MKEEVKKMLDARMQLLQANQNQQHVARVSAKIPPFWSKRPKIWFSQVEANFATAGIVTDETKFNALIAAIDSVQLECCEDIILNPPADGKYEAIKAKIISETSGTEYQRINRLLSDLQLGDRKPSRLLADMEHLAGDTIKGAALEAIFLAKIPRHTAEIIRAATGTIQERVLVGDKIHELAGSSGISSIKSSSSEIEKLTKTFTESFEKLNKRIDKIEGRKPRQRSHTPVNRSKSSSRSSKHSTCWYHYKFGDKAQKCIEPCDKKAGN